MKWLLIPAAVLALLLLDVFLVPHGEEDREHRLARWLRRKR